MKQNAFAQAAAAATFRGELDSLESLELAYGITEEDYADLQEMMNENSDKATSDFINDSDNLGYLADLLETYGFKAEQDSNKVKLSHPQIAQDIIARVNEGKFRLHYLGEYLSTYAETPQQTIGHILMIAPFIDRDSIYEDAKVYGWGLPTYRDTLEQDIAEEIS